MSNGIKRRRFTGRLTRVLSLTIILMLSAAITPASATQTVSMGSYGYGEQLTIAQPTPMYQNSALTIALEAAPVNAQAIALRSVSGSVKVYLPASKRAGWVPISATRQTNSRRINLAVVCSQSVVVRANTAVNSTQLATATNGQVLDVITAQGEWFNVRYVNPSNKNEYLGWVRGDFVVFQPDWIVAHQLLDVYAMPLQGANRVGQVAKGTSLMIMGEMNGYTCVNLRNASGFVRRSEVLWDD